MHLGSAPRSEHGTSAGFQTTLWCVVLAAKGDDAIAQEAIAKLCSTYWYPLYAFTRRQGRNPEESEDLIQDFFARLLEKKNLSSVRPAQGKFRSFLLASLKNFLANEWDRKSTVKRGGGYSIISWDEQAAEGRYLLEPRDETTPEKLFEQSWALSVIQMVLEQLRKDYADAGRSGLFQEVQTYLEEEGAETYAQIAAKLNMTEAAVKMAVLRLREDFRKRLRAEIAQTVADSSEIEGELRHLFTCLSK